MSDLTLFLSFSELINFIHYYVDIEYLQRKETSFPLQR